MTCRELASFILDYLSGELPPDQRAAFERHLDRCPNCVRYLSQYRATIALGRDAFDDSGAPVPSDVPEEFVRGVLVGLNRRGLAGKRTQ